MKTKSLLLFLSIFLFQKAQSQNWLEVGGFNSLHPDSTISKIITDKQNNLYAAGLFKNDSGSCYVAKWNGTNWSELGGINSLNAKSGIEAMTIDSIGNIYVAGEFQSPPNNFIAKFDGISWHKIMGLTLYDVTTMSVDAFGNIYAASGYEVDKYNGTNWTTITNGFMTFNNPGIVKSTIIDKQQHLLAVGDFTDNRQQTYVAVYTGSGTVWDTLGRLDTLISCPCPINTITADTAGNVYVAGDIRDSTGYRFIAKWDGHKWNNIGNTHNIFSSQFDFTDLVTDNKNLYAAGLYNYNSPYDPYVVKYNGVAWSKFEDTVNTLCSGGFTSIAVDGENHVYAIGDFYNTAGNRYVATFGVAATGISTIQKENTLHVFPNPTNSSTTITLTKAVDNATIKLINLTGQTIIEKQNQTGDHFNLDILQQAQGIYFVEIRQADNVWRTKLVKQ